MCASLYYIIKRKVAIILRINIEVFIQSYRAADCRGIREVDTGQLLIDVYRVIIRIRYYVNGRSCCSKVNGVLDAGRGIDTAQVRRVIKRIRRAAAGIAQPRRVLHRTTTCVTDAKLNRRLVGTAPPVARSIHCRSGSVLQSRSHAASEAVLLNGDVIKCRIDLYPDLMVATNLVLRDRHVGQ